MRTIKRDYLEKLQAAMGSPDIKVITGVRRSGKSILLSDFEEYVAQAVTDANIIRIDFNDIQFEELQEYHRLHEYVEAKWLSGRKNFLLIDEVQMCAGFEKAINSLHSYMKYDIYLTGSNAFLLSSDLATLFGGRVLTIEVFPFSFKEFLAYYGESDDRYADFERYLIEGGFAGSYIYDDLPEKYRYIANIYDAMIMRDIQQKYSVQNAPVLRGVGDFLLDNVSRLVTGRNIANVLNANNQDTNNKTVGAYLSYLCNAYAFYKVKRYDVQGKKYLYSQDKYYLCDQAIKYAKLGTKNWNYGGMYENVVAIELLRRGYEIYVGVMREKEVDFVAIKRGEKQYIQVSYDIENERTFEREMASLLAIRDAYPKTLIARTRQPERQVEGVKILDIADWLLG